MIIIDVYVPVIGKSYDFSLDENTSVETITEDIIDLIIQSEGYSITETEEIRLFSSIKKEMLPPKWTFFECGIDNGDTLLLI